MVFCGILWYLVVFCGSLRYFVVFSNMFGILWYFLEFCVEIFTEMNSTRDFILRTKREKL